VAETVSVAEPVTVAESVTVLFCARAYVCILLDALEYFRAIPDETKMTATINNQLISGLTKIPFDFGTGDVLYDSELANTTHNGIDLTRPIVILGNDGDALKGDDLAQFYKLAPDVMPYVKAVVASKFTDMRVIRLQINFYPPCK